MLEILARYQRDMAFLQRAFQRHQNVGAGCWSATRSGAPTQARLDFSA
jgi:hypothetical protein